MFRQKSLFLLLVLPLALVHCQIVSAEPSVSHALKFNAGKQEKVSSGVGYPGVRLARLADGSTVIDAALNVSPGLRNNDLFFCTDSRLIKIDDVYVKGKSVEELSRKLSGPVYSTVDVTYLEGDRQVSKKLKRYSSKKLFQGAESYVPRLSTADLFNGFYDSSTEFVKVGNSHHASGDNLAAVAYFISATQCPKFIMPSLSDGDLDGLPESMEFFIRTGMYDWFDIGAKKSLEICQASGKNISSADVESLVRCASLLERDGQLKKARAICDKLSQALSTLSMKSKMLVLHRRASVIEKMDGKAAAFDSYKELAAYCARPGSLSSDFLLAMLKDLVTVSLQNQNMEIAEAAQLHVIDLYSGKVGPFIVVQFQDVVTALVKLADIYEMKGDSSRAQCALQKAISVYSENLDAQKQILLERLGLLCRSDLDLRLAASYARSKQRDEAQARLQEAKNQMPEAEAFARKALDLENWIGRSANSGKISAGLLASILREEGKNAEADKISVTHPPNEERSLDFQKLYNLRSVSSHMAPSELYASTAEEPLKKTLSEKIRVYGEASGDALKALNDLSRFYVQQKRYDEAEKVQLHELQMLDEQYGKCAVFKFGCCLNLAEIYIFENNKDKARGFAEMITTPPSDEPAWDRSKSTMRLANVWLNIGDREKALEYGRSVEKTLIGTPQFIGFNRLDGGISDCLDFMERVGGTEDVAALKKLQADFHDPSHASTGRFPRPPGLPDNE